MSPEERETHDRAKKAIKGRLKDHFDHVEAVPGLYDWVKRGERVRKLKKVILWVAFLLWLIAAAVGTGWFIRMLTNIR